MKTFVLALFLLSDKGTLAIKQTKGIPNEQTCQDMGKEAQRLDPKHVQSFKCYESEKAPKQ